MAASDGRTLRRLVRGGDGGIDAAAVLWLAGRGEGGFRLEDTDMARRRRDDSEGLFAGLHEEPAEPELTHGLTPDDGSDRYRSACERALEQLRKGLEDPDAGFYASARAILETALEGAAA